MKVRLSVLGCAVYPFFTVISLYRLRASEEFITFGLLCLALFIIKMVWLSPLLEIKGDYIYYSRSFRKQLVVPLNEFDIKSSRYLLGRVKFTLGPGDIRSWALVSLRTKDVRNLSRFLVEKNL